MCAQARAVQELAIRQTSFSRSVSITSVPTFGTGTSEQNYNDDLRVIVTVTFRSAKWIQAADPSSRFHPCAVII
jgi:hypothetical protein